MEVRLKLATNLIVSKQIDLNNFRACLDTSEKGDLEKCQLLGPYNQTFEYGTISEKG